MRAFIAVPTTAPLRRAISELQRSLGALLPGFRWIRPESIHLTVLFLGEIERAMAEALFSELCAAPTSLPRGRARVRGLGVLPPRGRPRLVWTGVEEDGSRTLVSVHAAALGLARSRGLMVDARPYFPHLTVGRARVRPARSQVNRALDRLGAVDLGILPVERGILYKSILGPGGARYEELASISFGASASGTG